VRALALTLLLFAVAAAADEADEAALTLADKTQTQPQLPSNWRVFTEAAAIETQPRNGTDATHAQRLSLDAQYDARFAPKWRAVFADRLDLAWRGEPQYDDFINTLKEAYLSWQPQPQDIFDLGRVNLRYGVATGYNPTDFFRAGAVRSIVSVAPASLRENRLGTAIVRGQTFWTNGALSALYAPKLSDRPNGSPFSPDFGSTNSERRWLLGYSQKLATDFNPQFLLFGEAHDAPQFGLNVTKLLNDATVAYLEWSGGTTPSLRAEALGLPDDSAFRSRAAAGVTYTAPSKLSLTFEYDYNGAGLNDADWDALRAGPPSAYLQYRTFVQARQDLPTQRSVFLAALWQDALVLHLDLSAFQRIDAVDYSRLSFLEARYHWNRADLALQWQRNSGSSGSNFGALSQEQVWQLVAMYFF
jgi:hypothetical protein